MLRAVFVAMAVVWTLPFVPATAQQTPITARSAVADLDSLKTTVEIPDFRIGGSYDIATPEAWANGAPDGVSLESLGAAPLRSSYIAMGTPETDENGEIVNAILISSYYSGDATSMYFNWVEGQGGNDFSGGALIGPGLLFDTDRFYVVMVDALGLWGASKPSDGLGLEFPNYTYYDMVQANYRLLRDHLNIGHVVLATGVSMGATQSYMWGLMHPDFVGAVMPVGGSTATDGTAPIAAWSFQLAKAGLVSDPIWIETEGNTRPKLSRYELLDRLGEGGPAFACRWPSIPARARPITGRSSRSPATISTTAVRRDGMPSRAACSHGSLPLTIRASATLWPLWARSSTPLI